MLFWFSVSNGFHDNSATIIIIIVLFFLMKPGSDWKPAAAASAAAGSYKTSLSASESAICTKISAEVRTGIIEIPRCSLLRLTTCSKPINVTQHRCFSSGKLQIVAVDWWHSNVSSNNHKGFAFVIVYSKWNVALHPSIPQMHIPLHCVSYCLPNQPISGQEIVFH